MQVKIYVPRVVEVPSEYLPALAQRALAQLGNAANEISATRGHLVRQAVLDGLMRELDELHNEDGSVDLFCDPRGEVPLEIEERTLSLSELAEVLHSQRGSSTAKDEELDQLRSRKIVPKRRAA